jgi:hypothetical protein
MQTEKTRKFIEACKMLVNNGEVKNDAEIISALDWEKTMFSNVKNGRKNVPNYIFKKFTEVYHPIELKESIVVEGDFQQVLGNRVATTAAIEAMVRVMRAEIIELKVAITNRPYADVALEFDRTAEDELKHILERLRNEQG